MGWPHLILLPLAKATREGPEPRIADMTTLQTSIPDDLSGQGWALAQARGTTVEHLIEEALRSLLMPEPFADEDAALAGLEALEAEGLRDAPWNE